MRGDGAGDEFTALREADPWAPVSTDGLPRALVAAVEGGDWPAAKLELEQVMDGLSTDGPYGRALLQLVRRLPIGYDPIFDRYRAAVAIDHGDWDDLRRCLEAAPFAAAELEEFRDVILASVNRTPSLPTGSPIEAPYAPYDLEFSARIGWYRHWAKRLPKHDARSRFSRPDVPVGRHFRFRALHHDVLLALAEAQGGSLQTATSLAVSGQRLGDEGEPLRDLAVDLESLTRLAMGQEVRVRSLLLAERIATPRGTSPLGTLEILTHILSLMPLMPGGWLAAAAHLLQKTAIRFASPRSQLLASSWVAAADLMDSHMEPRNVDLRALIQNSRYADLGLQVLPTLVAACITKRYADFQLAERLARRAGNVWAQIAAMSWMTALDPSPRIAGRLLQILDLSGWRRPVLVPPAILGDTVIGLMRVGSRGQALVELALGGSPAIATDVAARHAVDATLPLVQRLAGVEALERIGSVHARNILGMLERDATSIGQAARRGRTLGPSLLTAREVQVLDLAGEGMTNKQIASRLNLSQHTVARHLSNCRDKLGATNRAQAAVRLGSLLSEVAEPVPASRPPDRPTQTAPSVSNPYRKARPR